MNIKVPYTWLKNHLSTAVKAEEFQRLVSLSGPSVERIETVRNEPVLDVEVTTNRMDTASIRGIAREGAVILNHAGKRSRLVDVPKYVPKTNEIVHNNKEFPIRISVDHKLCPRVTAVIMSVKTNHSPSWLSTKLEQVDIRSLNNLIDITNYVMMEIGQPTHVFDADRLGSVLNIRASKKGEKLTTLDGKTHGLVGGDIVADNGKGALVDLIAIMGTANSVVTENTKRILFFIEHADPTRIRKTSMGLAIRTQAAQLNEKQLDPNLVMDAMLRGIHLFQEIADGELESPILDLYPRPVENTIITLPLAKVRTYLGIEIPEKTQISILEQLGCSVRVEEGALIVTIPTLRPDLTIPVDLIEEIARIYGYHNLPSVLMDTPIPTQYPEETNFAKEHEIKLFLAALGWQEIYTYSTVSAKLSTQSGYAVKDHVKIQNPLNDDHVYLRRSLIPSHEEIIHQNRHLPSMSVFELAHTYTPRWHNIPEEKLHLTLTSTQPFLTVKGYAEAVLAKLYILPESVAYTRTADTSAKIVIDGHEAGTVMLLPSGHTAVDFVWPVLLAAARRNPQYVPISQFTPIIEDMTLTLPEKTEVARVLQSMKAVEKALLSIEVKGVYKQNVTFTLKYGFPDKQIASEDVAPMRKRIAETVQKHHRAQFVGAV